MRYRSTEGPLAASNAGRPGIQSGAYSSSAGNRTTPALLAAAIGAIVVGFGAPAAQAEEAAAAARQGMIEEVVVTARKREERLIDAPVAVSALMQEEVERYYTRDLVELTARIPGVSMNHAAGGGAGGSIFIRGVGNLAVDYGADQPVSLVMDGMSFQRGHILDTGFFDVEAVEVLKGPQALFFGKNSPAGVISVTSVSPEVGGEMEGFVRTAYEFETEDPVVEAALSLPVGDKWAFRLAARAQDQQGGFLKNTAQPISPNPTAKGGEPTRGASYDEFPQQKQTVVRFTSVFEPNENLSAELKIFRSYTEQNDAGRTVLYSCADGPGGNPYYLAFPDPTQTCPNKKPRLKRSGALPPTSVAEAAPGFGPGSDLHNQLENEVQTLEINYDIGDFTLSSVTGHWDYRHREYTNYDYTSYAVVVSRQGESGESLTQELRLSSTFEGPLHFMVGGFYEDLERDLNAPVQILPNSFFPPGFIPNADPTSPYFGSSINYHQVWDNNIKSWSTFGSFEYDLSEQLTLSCGARFTKEERDSYGGNLYERGLGFSPGGVFYSPEGDSDNVSPELTLSWRPMEDLMTYVSYKTGFQSFGISNPGTVPNLSQASDTVINDYFIFDETEVNGFEIGAKGYFFDQSVVADVSIYTFEYEDLQVAVFDSVTTTFSTQNAGVASNTGIDASATWQASDRLQLRAAGQYNWLEFDEFEDAQCYATQVTQATGPGCHTDPVSGAKVQDLSGERYGGPPLQINLGATYDWMIQPDWGMELAADVIHHSEGYENRRQPDTGIDARTVSNLSARLYQPNGPWEVALICSNCFNEIYVTSIGDKPLGKSVQNSNGKIDLNGQIANPRLITLQATYRLGSNR
ncbi:MAG: TonB-dependent receptor [Gammaproteobacteria bacterium]